MGNLSNRCSNNDSHTIVKAVAKYSPCSKLSFFIIDARKNKMSDFVKALEKSNQQIGVLIVFICTLKPDKNGFSFYKKCDKWTVFRNDSREIQIYDAYERDHYYSSSPPDDNTRLISINLDENFKLLLTENFDSKEDDMPVFNLNKMKFISFQRILQERDKCTPFTNIKGKTIYGIVAGRVDANDDLVAKYPFIDININCNHNCVDTDAKPSPKQNP